MKRPLAGEDAKMEKKLRPNQEPEEDGAIPPTAFAHLDENLLFEVLKHADARTLATAACVSKGWHRTAQDERLWELICTRHWPKIGCGNQFRSVVLALGGFKQLHSLYLPLFKQQQPGSASASAWAPSLPPMMGAKPPTTWGKDEMNLFMSQLSIICYEKMNHTSRGR